MIHWNRVSLTDCPPQPWANGAGLTRELLTWPSPQNWTLRISVASIERSAPYSMLPGTHRWHTIIQGSLMLALDQGPVHLDPMSDPLQFDGATPCECHLASDKATAFNVMTRGSQAALVQRIIPDQASHPRPFTQGLEPAVLTGIYTLADTDIIIDQQTSHLPASELIWTDQQTAPQRSDSIQIRGGPVILVSLKRSTP